MTPDDIDIVARTCWGEARGEGYEGMKAVAFVIRNRAEKGGWWGSTPREVCLKPWQFSAWNENDPNRAKLLALTVMDKHFLTAREAAEDALSGDDFDITNHATHYHTRAVAPKWAAGKTPCAEIGNHLFYRDID